MSYLPSFQTQPTDDFELISASPSIQEVLGWPHHIFEQKHSQWLQLVHIEDRPSLFQRLQTLPDHQMIQCEYRIQNSQGQFQWVQSQFIRLSSPEMIVGTWKAFASDMEQPFRALEEQTSYGQLLEQIVESTPALFRSNEFSQGINALLAKLGSATYSEQVYCLSFENAPSFPAALTSQFAFAIPANLFAWSRHTRHVKQTPGQWLQSLASSNNHPLWSRLLQGKSIQKKTVELDPEISTHLQEMGIEGIFLMPIFHRDQCLGLLGFEQSKTSKTLTKQEVRAFRKLTHIIGVALKQSNIESRLSHYAFHDPLTNLPNRALLLNRLDQGIKRQSRHKNYCFAVIFLDLDRFKPINDRFGHDIGDCLLIRVAQRISSCVRPGDTVARLGGDEFVVLLDDIADLGDAEVVVKRVQEEITRKFTIEGHELYVDVSIGIVLSSPDYKHAEAILQKADLAMYRAKNSGKGCYRIFEQSMQSQMLQSVQTESEMRLALEYQEFEVHYQPIVDLANQSIKGFEALARWNHPKMGMMMPSKFIPIAEETGMIKELGMQILALACKQASHWQSMLPTHKPISINVNLSPKQFLQENLVQSIELILETTNLPPSCLNLELTENCILRKNNETLALIQKLRDLGIHIYLDDFGAGYSSLQYLNFFPLHGLKIDRAFTQKLTSNSETQAIVRSIVVMAQALNMDVVVEGIENQQQIDYLQCFQKLGGQGFLFSRPLSIESAEALLFNTVH